MKLATLLDIISEQR